MALQKINTGKIISVIFLATVSINCGNQTAFEITLKRLYKNTVPQIQTSELYSEISTDTELVILDTRERKEYSVCHIKNSVFAGYKHFDTLLFYSLSKKSKIIVYCSVGCRSERIGERFIKHGFSNVSNLYGGIFNWVNDGYEVVDSSNKPTNRIHAYSRSWGRFLRKGDKVYD